MSLAPQQQSPRREDAAPHNDAGLRAHATNALVELLDNAGPSQDICLTFPVAAPNSAEALLQLDEQAVYWQGRDGDLVVGLGAAWSFALEPNRDDRSSEAELTTQAMRASERLASCATLGILGAPDEGVRCFGGLAFQPGRASSHPWEAFGDGLFVIPRITLRNQRGNWHISLFIRNDEKSSADALLNEAIQVALTTQSLNPERSVRATDTRASDNGDDRLRFTELVRDILSRIEDGTCTKIVAAQRKELSFSRPLSVPSTLTELKQGVPSTVFAFKQGAVTFCGATPERLIQKKHLEIRTEALAGTFGRTETDYGRELLRSPKEHEEHQPVLEAIAVVLAPLCARLEYPARPEICELPHLLHLKTPIVGTLSRPRHILSLVTALHPTPAVGGVPRDTAVAFIREHEESERGWYAGPVGWFDGHGDGEFSVALRSGILNGDRAYLFAGAGIVSGSEPQTEFAETQLKLRRLKTSLRY